MLRYTPALELQLLHLQHGTLQAATSHDAILLQLDVLA